MSVGPSMSVEELNQLANMNQQVTNPNYGAGSGYRGGGIDLLQAGGGYAPNQAPAPAGGSGSGGGGGFFTGGGFNFGDLFNTGLDYYYRTARYCSARSRLR